MSFATHRLPAQAITWLTRLVMVDERYNIGGEAKILVYRKDDEPVLFASLVCVGSNYNTNFSAATRALK